jgi:cytochrome b
VRYFAQVQQPGERMQDTRVAIRVWDLPVRVFHWLVVALLAFQVVTGRIGGSLMPYHAASGYAILALVIFRILWGIVGSTHARFASFMRGPAATYRFARRLFSREAVPQVGHNPLGGWMVLALVLCLLLQATSGLFANDGADAMGPLAPLVNIATSNTLTEFHRWNLRVLIGLSGIHIAAVLFHLVFKKEELTGAMFTGVKQVPEAAVHERRAALRASPLRRAASREHAAAYFAPTSSALALFILAMLLVGLAVRLFH